MSSIIKTKTCTWVVGGVGDPPCGEIKKWHWEMDDDGNRVRSYELFCPPHMKKREEIKDEDE